MGTNRADSRPNAQLQPTIDIPHNTTASPRKGMMWADEPLVPPMDRMARPPTIWTTGDHEMRSKGGNPSYGELNPTEDG